MIERHIYECEFCQRRFEDIIAGNKHEADCIKKPSRTYINFEKMDYKYTFFEALTKLYNGEYSNMVMKHPGCTYISGFYMRKTLNFTGETLWDYSAPRGAYQVKRSDLDTKWAVFDKGDLLFPWEVSE